MLLLGSGKATSGGGGGTLADETQWSSADRLDLGANGVATSAQAWTVAVAARANDDVTWESFVWTSGAAYAVKRQGTANNFRMRWQDTANVIRGDANGIGSIAAGTLFSVLASIGIAEASFKVRMNGVEIWNAGVSAAVDPLRGPAWINTNAAVTAAALRLRGVWIGAGYLDPTTHYATFFDGDGVPSATMQAGSAIGGLSPQFSECGDAAAWEALPGKSTGFDLQDV